MKRIPLTQGKFALVDDADYEALSRFKWYLQNDGYAARNVMTPTGRGTELMHRRIAGAKHGDDVEVDHRDVDKLNNCRGNLRSCARAENLRNYPKRIDNTSGFKGVTLRRETGKWRARIGFRNRYINLGTFDTAELAHEFYCLAADMLHGEFARHA
jgi:hypothetical protein